MANFLPLKRHMFYCLDRFIEQYGLHGPFLEIGCGKGDVSAYLAKRGWDGSAMDFSDAAIAKARGNLARFPRVAVRQPTLSEITGQYQCVIRWDVLEHIEDNRAALRIIENLLGPAAIRASPCRAIRVNGDGMTNSTGIFPAIRSTTCARS